jgi:hypothetical protein
LSFSSCSTKSSSLISSKTESSLKSIKNNINTPRFPSSLLLAEPVSLLPPHPPRRQILGFIAFLGQFLPGIFLNQRPHPFLTAMPIFHTVSSLIYWHRYFLSSDFFKLLLLCLHHHH